VNKIPGEMKMLAVEALRELLERNGYRCLPCHSSTQAIESVASVPSIYLVLCDLQMPDLFGALENLPDNFEQLSPRQLEVAHLVSKGKTNYQIACELGITENTVKLYVSQILRLTHMHNRTQLALALSSSTSRLHLRVTAH
jgi:DNA-binding NarL/FixJ family response regulator